MRQWLSVLGICLAGLFTATEAKLGSLDKSLVVVNDEIITENELGQHMAWQRIEIQEGGLPMPPENVLRTQLLEKLIMDKLLSQLAEQAGLTIDDRLLMRVVGDIAKREGLSVPDFQEKLEALGADFAFFKQKLKTELLVNQLQQRHVARSVVVTDAEIDRFLKSREGMNQDPTEVELAHILIPLPESPDSAKLQEAEKLAGQVAEQAQSGESFATLAMTHSKGAQALKGGSLGWRRINELPTLFVSAVHDMKVNEVRGPFRNASGFHLIQLVDKRIPEQFINTIHETQARHILIKTDVMTTDDEARMRLTLLRDAIQAGSAFEDLAKEQSQDLMSSVQGGSLGWVTADELVPEFSEVMDALPLNEVSEPFRSPYGWHIMEVTERRDVQNTEQRLKAQARQQLHQRKYSEKLEVWLQQLRAEAYINHLAMGDH